MFSAVAKAAKGMTRVASSMKPWTRPADRSASYGPCGQPVDKLALAHRLTTLADLATTAPPLPQQQG